MEFKRILIKNLKENKFLGLTICGILIGGILGLILRQYEVSKTVQELIFYPGEIFLRGLQLMIMPVVFFSLLVGSASLKTSSSSKIFLRTIIYFVSTSLLNAIWAIIIGVIFQPGNTGELNLNVTNYSRKIITERKNSILDNFLDLGRNIVPDNIVSSFFEQTATLYEDEIGGDYVKKLTKKSNPNTLGVIVFALLFGAILSQLRGKCKTLLEILESIDKINIKMVQIIIIFTPIGVCSIVVGKFLEVSNLSEVLSQLGLFIIVTTSAIIFSQLVFMQLIYFAFLRKNPFKFFLQVLPASLTGFAAQSSAAALPVSLKCLDEKAKIDPRISHFVVPIGVTINMDGTAFFIAIASIFIAQLNNISLSFGDYFNISILATVVSIAAATVPHASLTLLFIALNAINAPTKDIGLLFTVDWFLDRIRTTSNVLGDCYASAVVAHLSKNDLKSDEEELEDLSKNIQ